MIAGSPQRRFGLSACAAWLALGGFACAARGHIASPAEIASLRDGRGLSASGKMTLSSPRGSFSARVVFGVAASDSLRIEIPGGSGLRFLLICNDGRLRADLPEDDAMFEGVATGEVMNELFGIDLAPKDLIAALLGSAPPSLRVDWRFDRSKPAHVSMAKSTVARLSLALDDPETSAPSATAFVFGPPRENRWTLQQMSERLGLKR